MGSVVTAEIVLQMIALDLQCVEVLVLVLPARPTTVLAVVQKTVISTNMDDDLIIKNN